MWLFNVMLLAFTNTRQAGGACSTYEVLDWVGEDREVRPLPRAICFHFFALTL